MAANEVYGADSRLSKHLRQAALGYVLAVANHRIVTEHCATLVVEGIDLSVQMIARATAAAAEAGTGPIALPTECPTSPHFHIRTARSSERPSRPRGDVRRPFSTPFRIASSTTTRPVLKELQVDLDEIDVQVFAAEPHAPQRTYQLTREVIEFHRAVSPLRNMLADLRDDLKDRGGESDLELRRALRGRGRSRDPGARPYRGLPRAADQCPGHR